MDVVFTFGACGPNADDVFEREKDMVSGFLETITVADTYYGVIEYGETKANIMARLGDFRNKERLNQYINTIPRSGEGMSRCNDTLACLQPIIQPCFYSFFIYSSTAF